MNPGANLIVPHLPVGSVGVEIGVWKGDSSALFLKRAGHLYLVDPWIGQEEQFRYVCKRFKHERVTIHRCTSAEFFQTFDTKVDWVYVDALHDYDNVLADLHGARSILKPGGVIFGDDYGNKPGVAPAVDEFAPERELLGLKQYAIFA